jgi:hypothetical protein
MSRLAIIAAVVAAALGADPTAAAAQPAASPGAFEVALGASWIISSPLTSGTANETTPTGGAFPLFTTSTTLSAVTAVEIQAGFHLGQRLNLFGAVSAGRRQLRIAVANDVENAAPVTATERLEQFTFSGGVLWALTESRLAPFISAEAGQLRQLHEEKTLVESGLVYMAGVGVNIQLTDPRADLGFGVRAHARAVLRSKQFLLNTDRVSPSLNLSLFVRF